MEECDLYITGRVQKVMYRDFACRKARALGVGGTVENLPDGSVHIVAQATRSILERYLTMLKKGSLASRVDDITVVWRQPTAPMSRFIIIYRTIWDRL
jgi:acylphosphatase